MPQLNWIETDRSLRVKKNGAENMLKSILTIFARNQSSSSRRSASPLARYGVAVISVTIALAAAALLRHYHLPHPFTSFSFAAIAIAFWYAGTGPGVLAAVLSYSALTVFFVPGRVGGPSSESYLIIYGVLALFLSRFSSSRRRAEQMLTEARDNLEIRVTQRTVELTAANESLQHTQKELSELTRKLTKEKLYL